MLYRLIVIFISGLAVNQIFQISFFTITFICLLLGSFLFLIRHNVKDITKISLKDTLIHVFYTMSFIAGVLYSDVFAIGNATQLPYETPIIVEGRVVQVEERGSQKYVSLRVSDYTQELHKQQINNNEPNLTVPVSPFSHYELYDKLLVSGEIKKPNSEIAIERQPLFFYNQTEKLFGNDSYIVSPVHKIETLSYQKNLWEQLNIYIHTFRETVLLRINNHMQEPYAGIVRGITFGDQDGLSRSLKDIYKDSGLIHIMVLSGANVSFIILIIFALLKNISLNKRIWITIMMSWLYILMTGLAAPSIRAGVMTNIVILSEYFGRKIKIENLILIAVLILSIINPKIILYNSSFHLTFLAIIGLTILPKILEKIVINFSTKSTNKNKILNHTFGKIIEHKVILKTTTIFLGIGLSTVPYILGLTGKTNLFGIIFTAFLEPIIWIITVLTFLTTIASFANNFLANILGLLNSFFADITLQTAISINNYLPNTTFEVTRNEVLIYYLLLAIIIFVKKENDIIEYKENIFKIYENK